MQKKSKEIYVTKRYKESLDSINTNDMKYIPSSMIGLERLQLTQQSFL